MTFARTTLRLSMFGLGAACLLLGTVSASAQYYEQRPRGGYWQEEAPPPPRHRQRRDWRDEGEGWGGYDRRPPMRQRFGGVCITSRGSCAAHPRLSSGAPCRCDIPGFGEKRGNVQ